MLLLGVNENALLLVLLLVVVLVVVLMGVVSVNENGTGEDTA